MPRGSAVPYPRERKQLRITVGKGKIKPTKDPRKRHIQDYGTHSSTISDNGNLKHGDMAQNILPL